MMPWEPGYFCSIWGLACQGPVKQHLQVQFVWQAQGRTMSVSSTGVKFCLILWAAWQNDAWSSARRLCHSDNTGMHPEQRKSQLAQDCRWFFIIFSSIARLQRHEEKQDKWREIKRNVKRYVTRSMKRHKKKHAKTLLKRDTHRYKQKDTQKDTQRHEVRSTRPAHSAHTWRGIWRDTWRDTLRVTWRDS